MAGEIAPDWWEQAKVSDQPHYARVDTATRTYDAMNTAALMLRIEVGSAA